MSNYGELLFIRIADLMETIVGEYVEELTLDDKQSVNQTFTSLTNEITYTGYKVTPMVAIGVTIITTIL